MYVLKVMWEEGLRKTGQKLGKENKGDVGVPTSTLPTHSVEH